LGEVLDEQRGYGRCLGNGKGYIVLATSGLSIEYESQEQQGTKMKFLTITTASNLIFFLTSATGAIAAEGTILRMECGAAGVVTAILGAQIKDGEPYFYTDIYSSGLNVGAKKLAGQAGASQFTLDDKGYKIGFFPGSNSTSRHFSFIRYGKSYTCHGIR
jgi:hypothetical protein